MPDEPITPGSSGQNDPWRKGIASDLKELNTKIAALTYSFNAVEAFAQETAETNATATKAANDAASANRKIVIIGLVLIVLAGAGFYVKDQADDSHDKIEINRQYLTDTCNRGNENRAAEKALWDSILAEDLALEEEIGYKPSREEREAIQRIKDTIARTYSQRDCTKVKEGQLVDVSPTPTTPVLTPVVPTPRPRN